MDLVKKQVEEIKNLKKENEREIKAIMSKNYHKRK